MRVYIEGEGSVEVPDDASPDEIDAIMQDLALPAVSTGWQGSAADLDPTTGMGLGARLAAAAGSGLAGQKLGIEQLLGLASQQDVQDKEALDAPLMARSGTGVGKFAGQMAAPVLAAMTLPGAATYAGAAGIGGLLGAAQPVAEGDVATGKAINTGVGALFGVFGQGVGNAVGGALVRRGASKAADAAAREVADATKNATTAAARDLGYVVPPTSANPSLLNRVLEGAAGKLTTQQLASSKNQAITDAIAKRAIGVADDVPLSVGVVRQARKAAGEAYEAIRAFPNPFKTDGQYLDDLVAVTEKNGALAREVPELASKDMEDLVAAFAKEEYTPGGAVEVIKKLRADAKTLFKSDDPAKVALAQTYRDVSKAIEDMIERNLAQSGDEGLLASFRAAREKIAITHSVEKAINEGSGHVAARKLGGLLSRGVPLKGELRTAAEFAKAYPKAADEVTTSMPGVSPLDFYGGGGVSLASGSPLPMIYPAARMGIRSGLLSKPYQAAMTTPSYTTSGIEKLLAGLLQPTAVGAAALPPLIYGNQ